MQCLSVLHWSPRLLRGLSYMFCLCVLSHIALSLVGIDLSRCVSCRWIMCGWCVAIIVLSSFLLASLLRLRQFIVRIVSRFWLTWVELIDVLLPVDMLEVFMSSTWLLKTSSLLKRLWFYFKLKNFFIGIHFFRIFGIMHMKNNYSFLIWWINAITFIRFLVCKLQFGQI